MALSLSLLLLLCLCASLGTSENAGTETKAKPLHFFHMQRRDHEMCLGALASCESCVNNDCPEAARNQEAISSALEFEHCHVEFSELRYGIPEWCMFNENGYYVDPKNPPPQELCENMNVTKCTARWLEDVKSDNKMGLLKTSDAAHKLAEEAAAYGRLQAEMDRMKREMEEYPIRLEQYKMERDQQLLEQARKHLANLEEDETVFADPVFAGLNAVRRENKRMNRVINEHDIFAIAAENEFVRQETMDKIPDILDSISRLQNRISSRKAETDSLLQDIKSISRRTAILQKQSTNLIYELTHARDVDGDVELVDSELFDMYSALKQERTFLNEANLKSTFAKLRLVGAMRRLVWEISKRQSKLGCDLSQRISL